MAIAKVTRLKKSSRKQAKPGALARESLLQWVVDFDAAGCIALKHGVCLALRLDPLAYSGDHGLPPPSSLERAYRTAAFRFASDETPGRVKGTAPCSAIEGDILVQPNVLFSWLKTYLLGLPTEIERWLQAPEETVRDCRVALDPEIDEDGRPLVLDLISEQTDTRKQRTRTQHLQNHELTARHILAVTMLAKFGGSLRGLKPDWSFIPEDPKTMEFPIAPKASIVKADTMRGHIARSIVDLLTPEQAARDYPGLVKLATNAKKGVQ